MHVEVNRGSTPQDIDYRVALGPFLKTTWELPSVENTLIAIKPGFRTVDIWTILQDEMYRDSSNPDHAVLNSTAAQCIEKYPRTTRFATVPASRVAILKKVYERFQYETDLATADNPYEEGAHQIDTVERLIGGQSEYTRHMEDAIWRAGIVKERIKGGDRGNVAIFDDMPDHAAGKLLETITLARCFEEVLSPLFSFKGLREEPYNVLSEILIDVRSFSSSKNDVSYLDVTNAIESGALRVV